MKNNKIYESPTAFVTLIESCDCITNSTQVFTKTDTGYGNDVDFGSNFLTNG